MTTRPSSDAGNCRICSGSRTRPWCDLLRAQTIVASRDELYKSSITQILKLLPYLRLDVLIAGIELTELPLESIYLIQREFALSERFDTFHHIEQPTTCLQRLV